MLMPLIIQALTLKAACWSAYEKAAAATALGFCSHLCPPCYGAEPRSNESHSQSKRIVRVAGTESVVEVIAFPTSDVRWGA